MTSPPQVRTTWPARDGDAAAHTIRAQIEAKPLASDPQVVAAELSLEALPWRLIQDDDSAAADAARCELSLDFGDHALQCKVLQLQIASSARHVELYVDGVRRSLLGEDERSEVYFGTFRGVNSPDGNGQRFDVAQEFTQSTRDHDVLKKIYKLRVKFVSLTGDKRALELTAFTCRYVAMARPPVQAAALHDGSATPSAADMMGMMAGLSLGGPPGAAPLNPQMIMLMVQQMMEREMESKITRALDAKLSVLAQRLAFSEQMLLQVQQKTTAKDAQLEQKLEMLQQQIVDLRGDVTAAAGCDHTEDTSTVSTAATATATEE